MTSMFPHTRLLPLLVLALVACGEAEARMPDEPAPDQVAPSAPTSAPPAPVEGAPATIATPAAGEWIELGHHGDDRHRSTRVRAWVPTHEEGARLPVLFVLDGQGVDTWFQIAETITALVGEQRIEPWIVVAIEATLDRNRELGRTDGVFARYVRDVILPVVRERLPTREGRASTAILGYSYGGLAAVASGIAEPDTFGRVIAMSPSLWMRERDVIARFDRARTRPVRLWIDVGSREGNDRDVIPYMVGDARDLRDVALRHGMVLGRDVGFDEALGEAHDMSAAGRRMRQALMFALSDRDLSRETPSMLSITRYPPPRRASRGGRVTHAIQANYEGDARLTFPESLVEARAGETPLTRDLAGLDRPLRVRAFGLEARCD